MATPRTPDDGRNERQRQREQDIEEMRRLEEEREAEINKAHERQRNDPHSGEIDQTQRRDLKADDSDERRELIEEKPFDYIERTRPEDPSSNLGQQTRDNVNPAIPSSPPGTGDVVRPMSTSGGVVPAPLENQPEQWPKKDPVTGQAESREAPPLPDVHPDVLATRYVSPNEPWGSNVGGEAGGTPPPEQLPSLVLSDIDPDSIVVGSAQDFVLTVTGEGFDSTCMILFDDEEYPAVGDATTITASIPVSADAGVVDVEVHRGEEMSDVLTFEFVAPAGRRSSEKAERKPKKETPRGKRAKKTKR